MKTSRHPLPATYPLIVTLAPDVTAACQKYIVDREAGRDLKAENTNRIFDAIRAQFDDSFVYGERCAASFFLHILQGGPGTRAVVYEMHLTEDGAVDSENFTRMVFCEWANKDDEPAKEEAPKKSNWPRLRALFAYLKG
jgi:hypothetical protein